MGEMGLRPRWSRLLRYAEDVLAMETFEVVQDTGIQDFPQLGSGNTNRGSTDQAPDQGASQTTQSRTCRAGDDTDRQSEPSTG